MHGACDAVLQQELEAQAKAIADTAEALQFLLDGQISVGVCNYNRFLGKKKRKKSSSTYGLTFGNFQQI